MIIVSCILCSFCSFAKNETINQPSEQDAVLAIGTLMALPDNLMSIASARIGTCVPAINAKNEGQIACTTVIDMVVVHQKIRLIFILKMVAGLQS